MSERLPKDEKDKKRKRQRGPAGKGSQDPTTEELGRILNGKVESVHPSSPAEDSVGADEDKGANKGQQARLVRAILFPPEEQRASNLMPSNAELLPEEVEKFLERASTPEGRTEIASNAVAFISTIIGDTKQAEYLEQLQLLLIQGERRQKEREEIVEPQQPEQTATAEAARLEGEVQRAVERKVDERIEAEGGTPAELQALYGETPVPPRVLEMYKKLPNPLKKEGYLAKLKADIKEEEERKKKKQEKRETKAPKPPPVIPPPYGPQYLERKHVNTKNLDIDLSEPETPSPESIPALGLEEQMPAVFRNLRNARAASPETVEPQEPGPMDERSAVEEEWLKAQAQTAEMTPAEARSKLDWLITGYKKTLEGAKGFTEGVSERFVRSKNFLNERAKTIDATAQMSGLERTVRTLGEKYNKLSLLQKLGIGAALGVGTAVGSAVSLPLALVGLSGLVIQRGAGAASMFLKVEKDLQEKKIGESFQLIGLKERAAIDAALYTVVMGTAINQGLELAREHNLVERTREWLASMFGHETPAAVAPAVPEAAPAAPAPMAEVPKGLVTEPANAMPSIDVEASAGKGYEWMMKRTWEELQAKGLSASDYPEGSDIRRLLETDATSIDKVVHQMAADPQHGFFKPDGTSVRIDLGSHMTIGADGNIQLGDAVNAPEGAPVTAPYHPESVSVPSEPTPLTHENGIAQGLEQAQPEVRIDAPAPEDIPVVEKSFVTNQFGLTVRVGEPHIYADAGTKNLLVYGGSPDEQAKSILGYLKENPDKVVYAADDSGQYRLPWRLVEGEMVPGTPVRTGGFLGFLSRFMGPPAPEEFTERIQ